MSRKRKPSQQVPVEDRIRVVLVVLSGEMSMAEAARRHGVSDVTVAKWRDRFVAAGKAALKGGVPGPAPGTGQTVAERRLRAENEELKLALAEQLVQLRIWQKGAEYVDEVPSQTSKP